jgi:hypothetical protein
MFFLLSMIVKGMSIEELDEKYEEDGHDYLLDTFGEPHRFLYCLPR